MKRVLEEQGSLEMEGLKNKMVEEDDKKGPVHECDIVGSFSSSGSGISSGSSLESNSFEEVTSAASSFSSSSSDPLSDMSSLFQQLPIKRGLSKYYQGKSQSFTSLANVRSLEDLAKTENPYNKKLKCCRSYGGGLEIPKCTLNNAANSTTRHVSKRGLHSKGGSCSSPLSAKRGSATNLMSNRPPIPAHRSPCSSTIPNQTALLV